MALRTIAFCSLYFLSIAAAFIFPPAGVWGFVFESNYHPPYHHWGGPLVVLGNRWSFYIGAAMIGAVLLHWGRYSRVRVFSHPQTILLILFTANTFVVSAFLAEVPEKSWKDATDILKWLLVFICYAKTHSDRRWVAVPILIYLIAAIDGGWEDTFHSKGGRRVHVGPVTTGDENFVSAQVVALIPPAVLYALSPGVSRWLRLTCLAGLPLMLNTVAHASSRGAFLAMLVAAAGLVVFTSGRQRLFILATLAVGSLLAVRLFHEQFWDRMNTIQTYEQDGSAGGRIEAWQAAWALAQRNVLGYGGEAFDSGLGASIMPDGFHTTHNMFFEILVAWGFQGTAFLFAYIAITLWDAWRIARHYRRSGDCSSVGYAQAVGTLVGLLSMLAASVFLNRMRWEMWWIYGAFIVCQKNILLDRLAAKVDSEAEPYPDEKES